MPRVLITSVGGSCEPVINACREYKPDFIYFFCSAGPKGSSVTVDGEGDPCGDKRSIKCASCGADIPLGNPKGEAIVKRLGLRPDSYEKVQVDDPDDLEACYTALLETEEKIVKRFGSRAEVIANYTGGTKTMSAALALIAVFRERWDLSVNKGPRVDLIKVRSGDMPVLAGKLPAVLESYKTQAARFLKHYAYDVADAVLADLTSGRYLSAADRQKFLRVRRLCQAFHAWDSFDHQKAWELLRTTGGDSLKPFIENLAAIADEKRRTRGFEKVGDLLLNAARRASQGRYDDAVARLYRTLEMLAQLRLELQWGIRTGALETEQLPENLRGQYERLRDSAGRIRLPLVKSYELLADLGDPAGRLWQENKNSLLAALEVRNNALLAHGTTPVGSEDYERLAPLLEGFICETIQVLGIRMRCRQLPREELLEM
ncbi:MAG: TIGR02710 family CRISPR-associated CARF protein [Bacillota bacterium]